MQQAPALLSSGFDMIACLSVNDPWVLDTWRQAVDSVGSIRFLSDGNLEFGHACCLTTAGHDLFVGTRLTEAFHSHFCQLRRREICDRKFGSGRDFLGSRSVSERPCLLTEVIWCSPVA